MFLTCKIILNALIVHHAVIYKHREKLCRNTRITRDRDYNLLLFQRRSHSVEICIKLINQLVIMSLFPAGNEYVLHTEDFLITCFSLITSTRN